MTDPFLEKLLEALTEAADTLELQLEVLRLPILYVPDGRWATASWVGISDGFPEYDVEVWWNPSDQADDGLSAFTQVLYGITLPFAINEAGWDVFRAAQPEEGAVEWDGVGATLQNPNRL